MTEVVAKLGWQRVGASLGEMGRHAGRAAAGAWNAIDPALLHHAAQLPLMGLTLLGPSQSKLVQLPDDGYRPIVFIHGLGGHRSNFAPMRLWFRMHGRTRTYSVGFSPDLVLDEMAGQLRVHIAEVLACNGLGAEGQVDLVAHSMGGVIARLAVADAITARQVASLVTLGTPHAGTQVARLARTPHIRELRPDSTVMRRLAEQLPWQGPPHMPKLTSLWSDTDLLLFPPTTACVEGAENVEMRGFTHYSYLLEPASARQVFTSLRR